MEPAWDIEGMYMEYAWNERARLMECAQNMHILEEYHPVS